MGESLRSAQVRRSAVPSAGERVEVTPLAVTAAAVAGTWVAHSLEYVRVFGPSQFPTSASRSMHLYMGPAGVVIGLLALVSVPVSLRAARLLGDRVELLRGRLASGRPASGASDSVRVSAGRPLSRVSLVGVLWAVQTFLYVVQENVEARATGLRAPGLAAVTGIHRSAVLVHLAVAIVVASVVWLMRRPVTRARQRLRTIVSALERRARRVAPPALGRAEQRAWTPAQRWGMSLWARPPPASATS